MKICKSERGQALVEYMPLIPPGLLLSVLILVPLAGHTGDVFCHMINTLEPDKCVVAPPVEVEETLPEEEDDCLVLDLNPQCNRGIGNLAEGCDPGNSSGKGKGGGRRAGEDREEDAGPQSVSQCLEHGKCSFLPGVNTGSYWASDDIETIIIMTGNVYSKFYSPGQNDGCFNVHFSGNYVHWEKVGSGNNCGEISHVQAWSQKVCQ